MSTDTSPAPGPAGDQTNTAAAAGQGRYSGADSHSNRDYKREHAAVSEELERGGRDCEKLSRVELRLSGAGGGVVERLVCQTGTQVQALATLGLGEW